MATKLSPVGSMVVAAFHKANSHNNSNASAESYPVPCRKPTNSEVLCLTTTITTTMDMARPRRALYNLVVIVVSWVLTVSGIFSYLSVVPIL